MPRPAAGPISRLGLCLAAAATVLAAFGLRVVALDAAPPGLHFDEAVYGLMARDILHGARPVFFSAYTGREPLYMYVMALVFALVGDTSWSIRLTSAGIGTVTVALTFALARALYGPRVGWAAAAVLAVSYWHVTVSRNGYPNVLIPPLEAASAFFLWRAWSAHPSRRRDWALGGALAGLVLYTYLAARFWPVFLLVFLAYVAAVDARSVRDRLPGLSLAGIAALAVVAPLGLHFARHPEDFFERANQVLAWRQLSGLDLVGTYAGNAWQTLRGLVSRGDPRWHYNLPGRPVFQPWLAVFLLVGAAASLRRWREPRYALPLLWVLVLVLPGVLTLELQPAGQRIFGILPALAFLPAIGLVAAARWVLRPPRRSGRGRAVAAALAAAALVAVATIDGAVGARDYFLRWAHSPETRHIFNQDYAAMAAMAARDVAAGENVVLLSEHYKHPTVAFLAPETVDGAAWADGALGLVWPAPRPGRAAADAVVIRLTASLPDGSPAARALDRLATEREERTMAPAFAGHAGPVRLGVVRYRLPRAEAPASGAYRLGSELQAWPEPSTLEVARNEPLVVPITWSVSAAAAGERRLALHLRDRHGWTWAQSDQNAYLSEQWRPGDVVRQWFALPLDRAMPPGVYTATLVLADGDGRTLPVAPPPSPGSEGGASAPPRDATGDGARLARVRVLPEGRVRAGREDVPRAVLASSLALMEAMPDLPSLAPGSVFACEVLWAKWGASPPQRVDLELASGARSFDLGGAPVVADEYPPSAWRERELARARYRVRLPDGLPGGAYEVLARAGGDVVPLGRVEVVEVPRRFDPPPLSHVVDARFEGLRLLGYDVVSDTGEPAPGGTLGIRLVWQSDRATERAPKVFVHLYDEDGRLVAQHDGAPDDGRRPVPGWLPGEVVVDTHPIALPEGLKPGAVLVPAVGLYDPETGERWPVEAPSGDVAERALRLSPLRLGP